MTLIISKLEAFLSIIVESTLSGFASCLFFLLVPEQNHSCSAILVVGGRLVWHEVKDNVGTMKMSIPFHIAQVLYPIKGYPTRDFTGALLLSEERQSVHPYLSAVRHLHIA